MAGGVVTNLREVLVPIVTPQEADVLAKEVSYTLFLFVCTDRLETPITIRKYWSRGPLNTSVE